MDQVSNTNLKSIDQENKLRLFVSELITPLVCKVAEQEQSIQDLLLKTRQNSFEISALENNLRKTNDKIIPSDEITEKINTISLFNNKQLTELEYTQQVNKLTLETHSFSLSDLTSKINSFQNAQIAALASIDHTYKTFIDFKNEISLESSKSILRTKAFIDAQDIINSSTSDKINKLSLRISEINSKGFAEVNHLIQEKNLEIVKIKESLKELFGDRVVNSDFKKLKNKVEGDLLNVSEKFLNDLGDIKAFLDQMLRVEITCGISDTLLKVLDARQIKKLIPLVENLLGTDYLSSLDPDQIASPKPKPIPAEALYNKTVIQTKSLEVILEDYKKKISQEEDLKKKFPEKTILTQKSEQKRRPTAKKNDLEKKSEVLDPIKKFEHPYAIKIEERNLTPTIKSEDSSVPSCESRIKETDESFMKLSEQSGDFQTLQEKFEFLKSEIKSIQSIKEEFYKLQSGTLTLIKDSKLQMENAQKEFRMSFLIFSEEIDHKLKVKSKETQELSNKTEAITKSQNQLESLHKDLESQLASCKLTLNKLIEADKIMNELLSSDEEDRQTLHLAGLADKRESRSPTKMKQSVTLKPECLACAGQSVMLYSAFKLACLNYYPSEVKYSDRMYSRKELLKKLQRMLENIWSAEGTDEDSFVVCKENNTLRAKSAGKVKISRHVLDATMTKSSIHDSPKKLDLRVKQFHY